MRERRVATHGTSGGASAGRGGPAGAVGRSRAPRCFEIALLTLVAVLDAVIIAVLPACFREIGLAFEATQSSLGGVLFVRGLAQAGAALLAGISSPRVERPMLILAGCWTWGVGAACLGAAPNIGCMLFAVALNGVGAGILKPVLISMLADLAPKGGSGKTFSLYDFTNSVAVCVT